MMSAQCATCGAYYTGNESFCARCGAPRVTNAYQQNPYGQPAQQQSGFGAWAQNYYTPQRIVRRMIIGRVIGLGVAAVILLGCAACVFFNLVLAAHH